MEKVSKLTSIHKFWFYDTYICPAPNFSPILYTVQQIFPKCTFNENKESPNSSQSPGHNPLCFCNLCRHSPSAYIIYAFSELIFSQINQIHSVFSLSRTTNIAPHCLNHYHAWTFIEGLNQILDLNVKKDTAGYQFPSHCMNNCQLALSNLKLNIYCWPYWQTFLSLILPLIDPIDLEEWIYTSCPLLFHLHLGQHICLHFLLSFFLKAIDHIKPGSIMK